MKRILALCVALLLIFALASCGDAGEDDDNVPLNNYYVTYNGVQLEVGVEMKNFISKIGEYTSVDGEACGTNEKDVIYTLSGVEIEKRLKSIKYIEDSLNAAHLIGAETIVVHTGSAAKITRQEAMKLCADTLVRTLESVDTHGIKIGLETILVI